LAAFVSKAFALLEFFDDHANGLSGCTQNAAIFFLKQNLRDCRIACSDHEEVAFNIAIKIIVNIFFNIKQKLVNDAIVKDTITGFKKRQRAKE